MTAILGYLGIIGAWAIQRLPLISIELGVFVLLIMFLLRLRAFRQARIQKWFWLVVLVKPIIMLIFISPLALNLAIFQDTYKLSPVALSPAASQSGVSISGDLSSLTSEMPYPTADAAFQHPSFWSIIRGSLDWPHGIAILWLSGLTFLCARALMGFHRLRKLRRQAVPTDCLHDTLASLGGSLEMRRLPEIRVSREVSSPLLFGLFRPVILLPPGLCERLSPESLRLVLLHELFHWKRRDTWTLLFKRLVEALFFFHPAVWYAGRIVVRASEQACDDAVVSFTGSSTAYASCLLSISEGFGSQRRYALAGLAIKDSAIGQRIKRILKEGIPVLTRRAILISLSVLILVCILGWPALLMSSSGNEAKIAFVSFRDANRDGNSEIYVMDADGSNPRRLTSNPAIDGCPSWSPDGKSIAFDSNRDGNNEIYVMEADGKNPRRLTNNPADGWNPSWSPDGRKIAFTSNRDGDWEVYVMDADGKDQRNLSDHSGYDYDPSWSPDCQKIAYTTRWDENYEVYVMDANGSNQRNLTNHPDRDNFADWSPDGKKIAFVSERDGNAEIYVMDADGSNLCNLTNNPAKDVEPSWSPDDQKIAFTSDRDGNPRIYVMDADGKNLRSLTNTPAGDWGSDWFDPDFARPVSPAGKFKGTWGKIKTLLRPR